MKNCYGETYSFFLEKFSYVACKNEKSWNLENILFHFVDSTFSLLSLMVKFATNNALYQTVPLLLQRLVIFFQWS